MPAELTGYHPMHQAITGASSPYQLSHQLTTAYDPTGASNSGSWLSSLHGNSLSNLLPTSDTASAPNGYHSVNVLGSTSAAPQQYANSFTDSFLNYMSFNPGYAQAGFLFPWS